MITGRKCFEDHVFKRFICNIVWVNDVPVCKDCGIDYFDLYSAFLAGRVYEQNKILSMGVKV